MRRGFVIAFFIFLFFALRVEHGTLFYDLGRDKRYQMTAAANLASGHGITHCITYAEDISKVSCQELTWWAAGYPVVIAGLYRITGDLITSDFLLIVLGLAMFLFASFRFLSLWRETDADSWISGAFFAFISFSFAPFNYLPSTDLVALGLLLISLIEASLACRNRSVWGFVFAGSAAFGAAFFKFSYYPFLATVPLGLVIIAFARRRSDSTIANIAAFLTPVLIGFLLIGITFPNHLLPPGGGLIQGWHFENLLYQDPFATKSLFFFDFLIRRADGLGSLGTIILAIVHTFSITILITITYASVRHVLGGFGDDSSRGRTLFAVLGLVTGAISISYLSWLSIRLPLYHHPIYAPWTFVQETRYYAPAMVLLVFATFVIPLWLPRTRTTLRSASIALIIAISGYAVAYWTGKNIDYFYNGRIEGSFAGGHKDDADLAEFLRNESSFDRTATVLGFVSHASAYGYPTLLTKTEPGTYPFPWFDWYPGSSEINTSQPRTLLIKTDKQATPDELKIIAEYNGNVLKEFQTFDVYRLEIQPK